MIVPSPARCGDEIAFADLEGFALDDQPGAMAFQDEPDRARHMAVRQRIFAGLEQLQIQYQGARGAVFQRRIPQLDDTPERDIEADHLAGFFHGGEEVFAFPVAGVEGRHRLACHIALLILPIALEVLALQLVFELFQCFGHNVTSSEYSSYLARFAPTLQGKNMESGCGARANYGG